MQSRFKYRPSRSINRVLQAVPISLPIGQHFEHDNGSSRRSNGRNGTRTTQSSSNTFLQHLEKGSTMKLNIHSLSVKRARITAITRNRKYMHSTYPYSRVFICPNHGHNHNPVLEKYDNIIK